MSPGVQAVVALVFVALLGGVLIQPILDAVDAPVSAPEPGETARPEPSPSRPEEASATQTPEASPGAETSVEITGPLRTQPLSDRYPRRCLRPATPRTDRLVFVAGGLARTATDFQLDPGQGQVGASSLVGLDPPATTYATYVKPRDVLFAPWEGIAGADGARSGPRIRTAAWSPISSCALTLTSKGSLHVVPNGRVLVPSGVRHFAFSPDGTRVALVLQEGATSSVWLARLSGERMREIYRVDDAPRVRIQGWAPDGKMVYLTRSRGDALRYVTVAGSPQTGRLRGTGNVRLERCPQRLLGLLDGAVIEIRSRKPLSYLSERSAEPAYTSISCSPDGRFIAAIRDDTLVLLDSEGNVLRDLATDGGYRDIDPEWGDAGSGVLFGRIPQGGGPAEVWHVPEGGVPRNTGLVYRPGPRSIDWSGTPPTGLP